MRKWRRVIVALFVVLVLCAGGFLLAKYVFSQEAVTNREKAGLPTAVAASSQASAVESAAVGRNDSLIRKVKSPINIPTPEELNLDVPFTSQAPSANWDYTHEEACEEAAILMAGRYFRGIQISNADDAEKGLQGIISWEKENLGFFESTTAEETVKTIEGIYALKTETVENPTTEQIKSAIAAKKLVLVPTAGRQIGNPFYKSPGPLYHMLLIKGYTKTQFITNDAGTKRGENYPYKFETILNANHDWNGGDVASGRKVIIFVSK